MSFMGRQYRQPTSLDFHAFRDRQSVFDLDPKIADCAVHLGMAEGQLNSLQVTVFLVDVSDLGPPPRMRAIR